jgi:hypothetical protein
MTPPERTRADHGRVAVVSAAFSQARIRQQRRVVDYRIIVPQREQCCPSSSTVARHPTPGHDGDAADGCSAPAARLCRRMGLRASRRGGTWPSPGLLATAATTIGRCYVRCEFSAGFRPTRVNETG